MLEVPNTSSTLDISTPQKPITYNILPPHMMVRNKEGRRSRRVFIKFIMQPSCCQVPSQLFNQIPIKQRQYFLGNSHFCSVDATKICRVGLQETVAYTARAEERHLSKQYHLLSFIITQTRCKQLPNHLTHMKIISASRV